MILTVKLNFCNSLLLAQNYENVWFKWIGMDNKLDSTEISNVSMFMPADSKETWQAYR